MQDRDDLLFLQLDTGQVLHISIYLLFWKVRIWKQVVGNSSNALCLLTIGLLHREVRLVILNNDGCLKISKLISPTGF